MPTFKRRTAEQFGEEFRRILLRDDLPDDRTLLLLDPEAPEPSQEADAGDNATEPPAGS
ncbi:hypothetical protein D3C75_1362760 [compost metagenome]|jgi:hypothetical protein